MRITAKAYAKINLSLDIKGILDNGYHLIDTVMQTVDICDILTVSNDASGIAFSCDEKVIDNETNLCVIAAKKFFEYIGILPAAQIKLKKNIPLAAGMGGGSSDAAAVLILLNKLYGEILKSEELEKIALSLGADVPFFLYGSTVRATGIGEKLEKIKTNLSYSIIIVKNGEKPSTAELYKRLDKLNAPETFYSCKTVKSLKSGDYISLCENIGNVFSLAWNFEDLENTLNSDKCGLSGSGPAVFGLYKDFSKAEKIYNTLKKEYEYCCLCKPVNAGVEIIE